MYVYMYTMIPLNDTIHQVYDKKLEIIHTQEEHKENVLGRRGTVNGVRAALEAMAG